MASGQLPFLHIRRLLSRQRGNLRGNMQMRHSPLNKSLAAQMGNRACINTEPLLYPIKQTDIIKLQIASLDFCLAYGRMYGGNLFLKLCKALSISGLRSSHKAHDPALWRQEMTIIM